MATDKPRDLADELGHPLPDAVAALPPQTRAELALLLRDARLRQADAVEQAVAAGLGFLPRVLRGTVTRLVLR